MTVCDVYIGDLDDPTFQWDGGDVNGNIPAMISPFFPPIRGHYSETFHAWVAQSGVVSKQTDYSGWVAIVNKAQIEDFLEFAYGDDGSYHGPDARSGWVDGLAEVRGFIDTLDPKDKYALVAAEW